MKIYDHPALPNPKRVRIALAEKGLADKVEFVFVDVLKGEHRLPDFAAKNPSQLVPVLELDDGTCISECTPIIDYLDQLDGNPILTGRTPKERAMIGMAQRRMERELLDAVVDYFHNATPGLGSDLETQQTKAWGETRRDIAVAAMHALDRDLGHRPYVVGDTFSMADITAFAGLYCLGFAKMDVPSELKNLVAWRERVAARPAVVAAMQ